MEEAPKLLKQNLKSFITKIESILKNREASLRNLEVQVGKIANLFSSNTEQDLEKQEEEIILKQQQEVLEEAEAYERKKKAA